jgi:F-type H+-transporting ATPase subunit alpha
MAAFAQFGSDLDKATQMQLARGERLVEILKQAQYQPLSNEKQILIIFAANQGFIDEYPIAVLKRYENELLAFFESRKSDLLADLKAKKAMDDELKAKFIAALNEFKKEFTV